jgi:hypothetical protein
MGKTTSPYQYRIGINRGKAEGKEEARVKGVILMGLGSDFIEILKDTERCNGLIIL